MILRETITTAFSRYSRANAVTNTTTAPHFHFQLLSNDEMNISHISASLFSKYLTGNGASYYAEEPLYFKK